MYSGLDLVKCSQRIRDLRKEKRESHATLADAIFVSEQTMKNYEQAALAKEESSTGTARVRAIAGMNINTLCQIADHFGVSTDYVLGRTDIRTQDADIQAACKTTGLSDESIEKLSYFQERYDVDFFIASPAFDSFIKALDNAYQAVQFVNIAIKLHLHEMDSLGDTTDKIFSESLNEGHMYMPESLRGTKWEFMEAAGKFLNELCRVDQVIEKAEKIRSELFNREFGKLKEHYSALPEDEVNE